MWSIAKKAFLPLNTWRITNFQRYSIFAKETKLKVEPQYNLAPKDINSDLLHGQISQQLQKPYLQELRSGEAEVMQERIGRLRAFHLLTSLPTKNTMKQSSKPIWVHYLIDVVSKDTFLSGEAMAALKIDPRCDTFKVTINGKVVTAKKSRDKFSDINIFGCNAIETTKEISVDDLKLKVEYDLK